MTAVRLDERTDNVENVIFSALVDRTESGLTRSVSGDSIASSTWEEEAYKRGNNWLPPPWVILAMIVVGFNEFVLLLRNQIYLLVIFVTFLLGKAILVQIDIPVLFRNGIVAGLIALSTSFLPTRMNISAGLTAEGQDRSATTTQKQQQLASRSFRNQKRRSYSVSCSSSIAESSVSSISTETGLESEYSSPLIRNTRRTHLHELFFWLHFKNMGVATNSGIDSLPEDLLTNILLRLPVKSLLLCKSVCKEWHAIISSPHFINKHFNHDGNPTRLVFYCNGNEFLCTYSYFPDENTLERHEVPDNLLLWGEITYLRGPCNGIFCIYIKDKKFVLWNPATRRLRFIQCCPSHIFDEMGFGVDPLTNDFKIVFVEGKFGVSPSFAVYTSSSDSWKYLRQESIRYPNALFTDFSSVSNAYLNGFYYWIMDTGYGAHTILAFDIHNETFEEITMPEIAVDGICLRLLNDSLALFSYDPFNGDKLMEIWLMEEKGCWTKFLSVVLPFVCLVPYGFWGRNKILVYALVNNVGVGELLVYDLDSNSARQLKVENISGSTDNLPIFYKENLNSLIDKNGIQDYDARSVEALEFLGYKGPNTTISGSSFRRDPLTGDKIIFREDGSYYMNSDR